jgi:putative SOS response-associated peptidase YedK
MIRRPLVGLVITVAITFIGDPAIVQAAERPVTPQRVMVHLADGRWETRALRAPTATIAALRANDPEIVEVAENRVYRQFVSSKPDDPAFDLQWHLTRNQASRSWQYADGTGVVVAVIDSGVAPVSDLACHTYVAPADFVFGISPGTPPDTNGHGTLVTQVIGECTDNGEYGAGTAPGAGLMPLRVFDSSGSTSSDRLFDALFWALDHGADVVNLSLGFVCESTYPTCSDSGVDYAIETLVAHGVVIVAASGNDGGGLLAYPANHPSVIAVGASGYDGAVASYSTRGPGLELVAPTGDQDDPINRDGVIHQGASGGLHIVNGTSFSSPQVAAAYAVLMSAGASPQQATSALLQSAQDIPASGYDTATGYGDLRIRDALAWGGTGLTPPIRDASFYAAGDATGDGRADSITYDGRFGRWWVSSSNGSSFSASQWTRYNTTSGWSIHTTGDFNGDDRLDLASFHPSNGTWWISPSNGSRFATSLWADFSTASGWGPQLVGDFTGDGKDDIANYHGSNGTWWVSRSTGTRFTTALWADFSTASGWKTHLVGDFNGDGRDDIASYHPSNGTWWVSRSTGTGFTTSLWADFSTASGWQTHLVGDFTGDGRDDIANYHSSNGTWWVSRSTGTRFTTALWADFSTASGWAPQIVGDFNGDGKDDIANYHGSNGTWWVSRSTGSAFSTGLWADYSTASGYTFQAVADFTGDGRDDIANHHKTGVWIVSRSVGSSFTTSTWFD